MSASPFLEKLLDCAKAIEGDDLNLADSLFKEIELLIANETKSKKVLVKYFAEALVRRAYKLYPPNPRPLVPSCTDLRAYMDYQFYPFFWFAHKITEDPVMDAIIGKERIHLIEYSFVLSSWRCIHLMRNLANKLGGRLPKSFRLTTIGPILSEKAYLDKIHERVIELAQELGIDFEMTPLVANCPADIVASTLKLARKSEDETIIVKSEFELHKLLAVPGASEKVLSKLKELKPELMVIVEQEAKHNGPSFLDWFSESFQYYSIIFESLEKESFKDTNHCKVLWEMYFRRQISNTMAQEHIDHVERHETLAQWRKRLFDAGFRPERLWFNRCKGYLFDDLVEYSIEEKNRYPMLCWHEQYPLAFASTWKAAAPTQFKVSGGDRNPESMLIDGDTTLDASWCVRDYGAFDLLIKCDQGNAWSRECPSINQIAASAEIFDMLECVCHVHKLPLALAWTSDDEKGSSIGSKAKRSLHIEKNACYVNDFTMKGFVEACGKRHLEEGQGAAGKALQSNNVGFVPDVSVLHVNDYPFVCDTWDFGLHGAIAIKISSIYMSNVDLILEFFLPPEMNDFTEHLLLMIEIPSTLRKICRDSWNVCFEELSRTPNIDDSEFRTEEDEISNIMPTTSGNSPLSLLIHRVIANDNIDWNGLNQAVDGMETHELGSS